MPNPNFEVSAALFLPIVQSAYQGLAGFVIEKNKEQDFFDKVTRKYVAGLFERNSTIKVLTMREPQPLEKLYVRANILKNKITAEQGLSAEELESFFQRDGRGFLPSRCSKTVTALYCSTAWMK